MTMCASQRVNTDPKPYCVAEAENHENDGRFTRAAVRESADYYWGQGGTLYHLAKFTPRPEFDNNPNPILVAYRKHGPQLFGGTAGWLKYAMHGTMADNVPITPDHIEHARKVLARLDALSEAGQ